MSGARVPYDNVGAVDLQANQTVARSHNSCDQNIWDLHRQIKLSVCNMNVILVQSYGDYGIQTSRREKEGEAVVDAARSLCVDEVLHDKMRIGDQGTP